jgi:hypothetical protein
MANQPIKISRIKDTAIVIGKARDVINAPAGGLDTEEMQRLHAFIADLELAARHLSLAEPARSELAARLRALEEDMKRPPDKERKWLRQTMNGIHEILRGAAGNATYAGLVETAKYFMLL